MIGLKPKSYCYCEERRWNDGARKIYSCSGGDLRCSFCKSGEIIYVSRDSLVSLEQPLCWEIVYECMLKAEDF